MRDTERSKPLSYKIQDYKKTLTIPLGSNVISDTLDPANLVGLNGLLRSLVIVPPATITGSSYSVAINNSLGNIIFTKTALAAGSTALLNKDENSNLLQIPIAAVAGASWMTITVAGDTPATGVLTSDNTNVSDAETVTVGTTVYRFKNTLAQIGDVKIGGSADASLLSLAKTINGTGVAGTDMFTGTPANTFASSSATVTSHTITLTALAENAGGNSIATTETSAHLSFATATLLGSGEASARAFSIEALIER